MNQLNSLIIEGNIVRNAELKEPAKDFKVCRFSVAVNRWYKTADGQGENEVSFFDVESFGKMAEVMAKQGSKGRGVRVVGRLKQDRWQEKDKTRSRVYVVAEHIEFKPVMNNDDVKSEEEVPVNASAPAEGAEAESQAVAVEVVPAQEVAF